jgi:hypothetical protein
MLWREDLESTQKWMNNNPRATTGWYRTVWVDPKTLLHIPGKMNEHLYDLENSNRVHALSESMRAEGFHPESKPLIIIEQNGQTFIFEGNHRIRAAVKAGVDKIPIDVRYEGGSEELPDVWFPRAIMAKTASFEFVTIPLGAVQQRLTKVAISLPELVQQTNAFSKKNRPGCAASLINSDPKELFLNYNVKCKLKTSDPAGHDVRVKFDVTKVEESRMAKDLNVQVSCSCPAFLYWGAQWNLHQRDGLYGDPRPELVAPTERLDLRGNYVICKHVHAVFERILPSVQHNIVKILRERALKDKEDSPNKLKDKQHEMKERREIERIRKLKNKEVQERLLEALREREQGKNTDEDIEDEDETVERDEPATDIKIVESPKAPGHPEVSVTNEPEDITDLIEKEEKKLKEEKHKELKDQPHLHTGLPYETDAEHQEHGHKLPTDRELLQVLKKKQKQPNDMKEFVDKKFKTKRTSLENSLLAALVEGDDGE